MKIHLLSDLHLEFSTPSDRFGAVDSDVVVLAGDIHTGAMGIAWAGLTWTDRQVIYVPGNHEYYRRTYVEHRETMRKVAADYDNLHLLDRGAVVIDDVLFIGATLWTNFEYWGTGDIAKQAEAMSVAARYMNDYHLIRVKDNEDGGGRSFMPEDSVKIFDIELAYLQGLLELDFETLAKRFNVDRITTSDFLATLAAHLLMGCLVSVTPFASACVYVKVPSIECSAFSRLECFGAGFLCGLFAPWVNALAHQGA